VLLCDSGWITDLRAQLELFSFGPFIEQLAGRFTVIRYDKPGCGLSDRDGADLSFEGQVAAALAVADATGARRFGLFGASQGGQLAAALAARYPDRVEALVLYGTCACGSDLAPAEVRKSLVALVRAHWGLGLRALAGAFVTDPSPGDLTGFARFQRSSASAEVAPGSWRSTTTPTSGRCSRRSGRGPRCCTARRTGALGSSWDARSPRSSPGRR
jgi:pimeloyl-ACP methyl ester carboxylesterase